MSRFKKEEPKKKEPTAMESEQKIFNDYLEDVKYILKAHKDGKYLSPIKYPQSYIDEVVRKGEQQMMINRLKYIPISCMTDEQKKLIRKRNRKS